MSTHPDQRIAWVDTAKGLSIILVVMMHSTLGVGEAMGREGWMHTIVAFAKPFRMPDFFLLSGLFMAQAMRRDWVTYIDRRVIHFFYFYVLWLLIQSLLKYGSVSAGSPLGFVEHLAWSMIEPFGTLWFIYLLAVFSLVTRLIKDISPVLTLGIAAALEVAPIHTGFTLVDEFCARYVYFLGGALLAPHIFAFAQKATARPLASLAALALWALINGFFAFTTLDDGTVRATLPFISLMLGVAGGIALVTIASLLTSATSTQKIAQPLSYAGSHSIAVYLAFFLPMAVTRTVLIKTGVISDVGTVAFLVTATAVIVPLILERLVRHTPLSFLFQRPHWAHVKQARPVETRLSETGKHDFANDPVSEPRSDLR